jgi:transcriptional regulator with XRE-family HTH domain
MRYDFKLAVLKSGRYQFEIAREANLSEGRLSRFIRGREQLRADEERRLREILQLPMDGELCEVAADHD